MVITNPKAYKDFIGKGKPPRKSIFKKKPIISQGPPFEMTGFEWVPIDLLSRVVVIVGLVC